MVLQQTSSSLSNIGFFLLLMNDELHQWNMRVRFNDDKGGLMKARGAKIGAKRAESDRHQNDDAIEWL